MALGLFAGKTKPTTAQTLPQFTALRIQSSLYGLPRPIVYGQQRVGGNLIWYGDFKSVAHASTTATGGKGGHHGAGAGTTTSYTYQAAVAIALCEGPITGLYNVWDTKGKLTLVSTSETFTVPGGGGSYTVANGPNYFDDYGVGRVDAYSVSANDYGDIPRTLTGNYNTRVSKVFSGPAAGQYSRSGGTYTFSGADAGKQMVITYVYSVPTTTNTTGQPLTQYQLSLFTGDRTSQTAWGYLTTNHPTQALAYRGTAYVADQLMDLGSSDSLPNLSWEVGGFNMYGGGITDANPKDILFDFLTNAVYGAQWSSGNLGNWTQFSNYCVANNLFLSLVIDSQRSVHDIVQEVLDATNSACFYSEAQLKIMPYGDTTSVGNGVVYTPQTTPVFDLNDDDFLTDVQVTRVSNQDVINAVAIEWINRSNDYNPETITDKDQNHIELYGINSETPVQMHSITTLAAAQTAINARLKRNVYIRNKYQFTTNARYILVEPMDLVTVTVTSLGLNKFPVRITSMRENENGDLEWEAEEFPFGTAHATLYPKQAVNAFSPQALADPGNVNTPIIFEAPPQLSLNGQHELWMAISGASVNWGGCGVWISQDGSEYKRIGTVINPARMGIAPGSSGVTADPYTGAFTNFDLTSSNGVLLSGSHQDADTYRTLMWLDGEFISHGAVTSSSANVYNIGGDYIRRGLLGSANVTHPVNSQVCALDDAIFKYAYDAAFIGKTISLKFTSFNTQGLNEQPTANVTAFNFVLIGKFVQTERALKNMVVNPGFEINTLGITSGLIPLAGQRVLDGWRLNNNFFATNPTLFGASCVETFAPHSGSKNAVVFLNRSISVPIGFNIKGIETDCIPVKPGEGYAWGGFSRIDTNAALPTGVEAHVAMALVLYGPDGVGLTHISPLNAIGGMAFRGDLSFVGTNAATGYQNFDAYCTIPATVGGVVPAFASVCCYNVLRNTTAGTVSIGAGVAVCDARFDDIYLLPQWDMTGNGIGNIGARSISYSGGFSYTSTGSSITWSWNFNVYRTDLPMTQQNLNSSQLVSGLATASTNFNFYPFIDEIAFLVNMVATGGSGSPAWAHTGTNVVWTQEQTRADHYALSGTPLIGATSAAGGSGGGSGGGIGGSCLRSDMKVLELKRGVISVDELRVGDWVSCPADEDTPDGWVQILIVEDHWDSEWIHLKFIGEEELFVTAGHPFTLMDGSMKRAAQLCCEDAILCTTGVTFVKALSLESYTYKKTRVTVDSKAHVFFAGRTAPTILQHNNQPSIS